MSLVFSAVFADGEIAGTGPTVDDILASIEDDGYRVDDLVDLHIRRGSQ